MSIKPLVSINHQSGLVEPMSPVRTHKVLVELLKNITEQVLGLNTGLVALALCSYAEDW